MSQDELFINGDLLRLRREARGWVVADMATRACMSVKQIRQLEEGGVSAFYSVAVKATAAKKVGALLGLSSDEVFGSPAQNEVAADEHLESPEAVVPDVVTVAVTEDAPVDRGPQDQEITESIEGTVELPQQATQEKSKTSIWVIAGLFATALALAAYMQPKDEPVTEAPPPLQAITSDAADAASAPDAPASGASAAESPAVAPAASAASVQVPAK
jgi:cytoskeleton protein RodZ